MGIEVRIFQITDKDTLRRLPSTLYKCLPEYAGKRVRYASAIVELANKKPIEIIQIQYSSLYFDSKDKIDEGEQEKEARMMIYSNGLLIRE